MEMIGIALVLIFCTPYGWAGMMILAICIGLIKEAWKG